MGISFVFGGMNDKSHIDRIHRGNGHLFFATIFKNAGLPFEEKMKTFYYAQYYDAGNGHFRKSEVNSVQCKSSREFLILLKRWNTNNRYWLYVPIEAS